MGENYLRLFEQAEAQSIPLSVQLELTGRCNLACRHCYLDIANPPPELDTETWLRVIDELAELGTMFLTLTGGELFSRRDVLTIGRHARALGMGLSLLTNGTRLTESDLDAIADLDPVCVYLSLYSVAPAPHDAITGRIGSHARTLASAEGLARRGVVVRLQAPLLQPVLDEVAGLIAFAEQIGASFSFDPLTITRRDGGLDPVALRPDSDRVAEVLALDVVRAGDAPLLGTPRREGTLCAVGRRIALILPNGDVMPCSLFPQPAGNVLERSLTSIWTESPLLRSLRALSMKDLDDECATCDSNGHCGRCSALALIEDGNLLGPSRAACDYAHARERAAELVTLSRGRATQRERR